MSRSVRIHHLVLASLVRPETNAWRASDLFHVSHWLDVPADTEFPYTVARMQLFARFYLTGASPTEFRVRITWLDTPWNVSQVIGSFGPFLVPFAADAKCRDCSFNLHNIRLQGTGEHRVDLLRVRRGWNAGKLVRVAATYFNVER